MSDSVEQFERVFQDCYEAVYSYAARRVAPEAVQDVVSTESTARRTGSTGTDEDIAIGETITARAGPLPAGVTDVQAILQYSTRPALLEGPGTIYLPVGRLAIGVP